MEKEETEKLRARLYACAVSKYRMSREDAEDLAHDAIAALLEGYPDKEDPDERVSIALGILANQVLKRWDKAARQGRWVQLEDCEPGNERNPEERMASKEILSKVLKAVPRLKKRERELFRLDLKGRSSRESAIHLGVTENNLHSIRHRYRKRLKRLVKAGRGGRR